MYTFKAFHAIEDPVTSQKFLEGHVSVLKDYGITNITSNNSEWMKWECVYGIVAMKEDGTIIGGIRIQIADGLHLLPVEKAIGHMDPNIHNIVNSYIDEGVGELCALWNAKEVAGLGLSLLLTRAGISMVNQVNCKTLMGICADYTMKMFRKVGFVVDNSLGDGGEFVYPNKNYIARVLGILNATDLSTAEEIDQQRMISLRNDPMQRFTESGPDGIEIDIKYSLLLKNKNSMISKYYFKWACLLFFILMCQLSLAQKVVINDLKNNIEIRNNVTFLEDKDNNLKIDEVIRTKEFQPVKSDIPNFSVSNSSFWLKVDIINMTSGKDFLLQISQPGLDEIDFYQYNSKNELIKNYQAGEYLEFNKRDYSDANYIFKIQLDSAQLSTVYLKVRARDNIQAPMKIGTLENIIETNKFKDTIAGVYVGIMLVMFVYNAFLFITVRDKGYFYYILYLGTVMLTQAGIQGYTYQYLWPGFPWLAQYSSFIFPPLVGISSYSFLRVFLHTSTFFPKLDKGFHFFTAFYLLAMLLAFLGQFKTSFLLIEICATSVSIYMMFVAYKVHKKGFRPARFFILAWSFFLIGVTIYVMKDFGILPYNEFTYYTMPLGSAVEVVLLSFALADRINILKKEKEDSQAEVLLALQENEKLITEANIVLEKKVTERTEELQLTNAELNVTLKNLKEAQAQLVDAEKMASLGQLTAGIAHEINNPINFVSANIKPLQMDIADILELVSKYESITPNNGIEAKLADIEKFKKRIDLDYVKTEVNTLLNGIEDGAKRTAEIVKGLKNFSHLDESDIKDADINQGIESTLVLLRSVIPKNIDVVKKLGVLPIIECYPGKLNQVFMNVLNNAVQAMEAVKREGHHTLTIESYVSGSNVCVSVEDTGTGMTPEVKAKIFEPFFTTKDVGSGTGLGMSIVFKIIESHNAKIEIDTEPGRGTKMTIILPMKLNLNKN